MIIKGSGKGDIRFSVYFPLPSTILVMSLFPFLESGCDFVACDNPHASPLTIYILAAVAEAEAKAISERTKAALAAAKARGVRLGSARYGHWKGREHRRGWSAATKAAATARIEAASSAYAFLVPTMRALRDKGASYEAIASRLNFAGHTTLADKPWTPTATWRILRREELQRKL